MSKVSKLKKHAWFIDLLIALGCLALGSLSSSGCSAIPSGGQHKDSALSYLDGHSYQVTDAVGGIPLHADRIRKSTFIRGTVTMDGDVFATPFRNQLLILLGEGDKEVLKVRTDSMGNFEFQGELPDGKYIIKTESKCFKVNTEVKVSQYVTEGLAISAIRDPSCYFNKK